MGLERCFEHRSVPLARQADTVGRDIVGIAAGFFALIAGSVGRLGRFDRGKIRDGIFPA